jgi:hypothetical protein
VDDNPNDRMSPLARAAVGTYTEAILRGQDPALAEAEIWRTFDLPEGSDDRRILTDVFESMHRARYLRGDPVKPSSLGLVPPTDIKQQNERMQEQRGIRAPVSRNWKTTLESGMLSCGLGTGAWLLWINDHGIWAGLVAVFAIAAAAQSISARGGLCPNCKREMWLEPASLVGSCKRCRLFYRAVQQHLELVQHGFISERAELKVEIRSLKPIQEWAWPWRGKCVVCGTDATHSESVEICAEESHAGTVRVRGHIYEIGHCESHSHGVAWHSSDKHPAVGFRSFDYWTAFTRANRPGFATNGLTWKFFCPKCQYPFLQDSPYYPHSPGAVSRIKEIKCAKCNETIVSMRMKDRFAALLAGAIGGWLVLSLLIDLVLWALGYNVDVLFTTTSKANAVLRISFAILGGVGVFILHSYHLAGLRRCLVAIASQEPLFASTVPILKLDEAGTGTRKMETGFPAILLPSAQTKAALGPSPPTESPRQHGPRGRIGNLETPIEESETRPPFCRDDT